MMTKEFLRAMKLKRLHAKGGWYQATENVEGLEVKIKAYNLWPKELVIGGYHCGARGEFSTVRAFNEHITSYITDIARQKPVEAKRGVMR